MTGIVLDTAQVCTTQIEHLVANNVVCVLRYLDPLGPTSKVVKVAEARALAAAGIRLGLISEGWGDFAHGGISASAGERDAANALAYAPFVGAPANAGIIFAVDTDAGLAQINKLVLPYFSSIAGTLKGSALRVGVYGSGNVCDLVIASGLASFAVIAGAMGWQGSRAYLAARPPELVLVQHMPSRLANLDVDTNEVLGDFGDFLPFAPSAPEPTPAQVTEPPNV